MRDLRILVEACRLEEWEIPLGILRQKRKHDAAPLGGTVDDQGLLERNGLVGIAPARDEQASVRLVVHAKHLERRGASMITENAGADGEGYRHRRTPKRDKDHKGKHVPPHIDQAELHERPQDEAHEQVDDEEQSGDGRLDHARSPPSSDDAASAGVAAPLVRQGAVRAKICSSSTTSHAMSWRASRRSMTG